MTVENTPGESILLLATNENGEPQLQKTSNFIQPNDSRQELDLKDLSWNEFNDSTNNEEVDKLLKYKSQ